MRTLNPLGFETYISSYNISISQFGEPLRLMRNGMQEISLFTERFSYFYLAISRVNITKTNSLTADYNKRRKEIITFK